MTADDIARLEAEHATLCAAIAPLSEEIERVRTRRAPLVDRRAVIESTLSAWRKSADLPADLRDLVRVQIGATIAAGAVASGTTVRG